MKKAVAIIPARYSSTRLPGKPLIAIGGVSMIERVYRKASQCPLVSEVLVATDHEAIFQTVTAFGGIAVMTSENCQSGTDRCAEVAEKHTIRDEIVVNVQGDEPFIHPEQISELIRLMQREDVRIGTLARQITDTESIFNPNVVKLVKAITGKALYFSRNPIPFVRGEEAGQWLGKGKFLKHIGLYGYKTNILPFLSALPPGQLERSESLEQLRWLEAGYDVYASDTNFDSMGIDTPEDLEKAEHYLSTGSHN